MAIDEKLLRVDYAKGLIKNALEYKGIDTTSIDFEDYGRFVANDGSVDFNCVAHLPLQTNKDEVLGYQTFAYNTPVYKGDRTTFSSSSYITLSQYPNYQNFSISIWLRGDELYSKTSYETPISLATGLGQIQIDSSDGIMFFGNGYQSSTPLSSAGITNTSEMFNIVLKVVSGVPYLYVNASLVSTPAPISAISSSFGTTIGCRSDYSEQYSGDIANVRIFDYPVTDTHITAIYNEGYTPSIAEDITTGLIAHWKLRGSGYDECENYHLTELNNSYVSDPSYGCVTDHSTSSDTVLYNDEIAGDMFENDLTISSWVYLDTNDSNFNTCIGFSDPADGYCFVTHRALNSANNYGTAISCWYAQNMGINYTNNSTAMATGVWIHLVSTVSKTEGKAFINGVQVGSTASYSLASYPLDRSGRLAIGGLWYSGTWSSGNRLDGRVRDVRIYKRVLSASEIEKLHNLEKYTRNVAIDEGLELYLPLKIDSEDHTENQNSTSENGTIAYDGNWASFDADGEYIDTGCVISGNKYTYSLWCNWNATTSKALIGDRTTEWSGVYFYMQTGGNLYIGILSSSSSYYVQSVSLGLSSNTTYHLGLVVDVDNNFAKAYVDGELVFTGTPNLSSITNGSGGVWVGHLEFWSPANNNLSWRGNIGRPRAYARALSGDEIKQIYNSEKGDFQ